jgi:predicted pyridoxine 5'-phosphate oxidase superfamily flavin-nucleotide-binding protein
MATILHNPGNHLKRIDKLWMVVSVDADGHEGVCAVPLPGNGTFPVPLIAADEKRLSWIKEQGHMLAQRAPEMRIQLIELGSRTDVEVLSGRDGK